MTKDATLPPGRIAELAEQLAAVGYWWYQEDEARFVWSDQMYRIYGRDPALGPPDISGVVALCHPDDQPMLLRHHALYNGKDAPDITMRIIRADGEVRHVLARSSIEYDKSGTLIARYGTLIDVTDIKRAESAARESEQRYRFLADHVPDMITRTGLSGEILYVSPSSKRVFGYTPEEMATISARNMVHPDDFARIISRIEHLVETRTSQLPEPLVYRARHKNGHWIWIEANPTLILDVQGEPVEFIDIVRDVSQTKNFEAELQEARKRAEDAAAAKAAFLANMSHELRTPLTSIIGFSQLMGARGDLPAEARQYARRITDASEALLALINDVLDFSKLDAGHVELESVAMSVAKLVEDATGLVSLQAQAKGLDLVSELDPATPAAVRGDLARLRQVVINFLSNAVKFTERGRIAVKTEYRGGRLKLSVTDTGSGIAPEAVPHLFERFSQAETTINRTHGGTGLGLAISKSIIDLMGGTIGVETELDKGSTFWFEIPAPAADTATPARPGRTPAAGQGQRILLVDDTAVNRELVRAMLSRQCHDITDAAGGAEAVAAAQDARFDLILMDVRMPRIDGLEATRQIRAGGPNAATPILALTADVDPSAAVACREAGMDDVITKPIVPSDLTAKIAQWGGSGDKVAGTG